MDITGIMMGRRLFTDEVSTMVKSVNLSSAFNILVFNILVS